MNVIHVRFEILFIADFMFVKPALPDGGVTMFDA